MLQSIQCVYQVLLAMERESMTEHNDTQCSSKGGTIHQKKGYDQLVITSQQVHAIPMRVHVNTKGAK